MYRVGITAEEWGGKTAKALALLLFSAVFFLVAASAEAATIGRPQNNLGLVGYWDFDIGKGGSTVFDRSGNRYHGSLVNATNTTNWIDGPLGRALEFDGVNDYASIAASDPLKLESGVGTITFWIYEDTNPSTSGCTKSFVSHARDSAGNAGELGWSVCRLNIGRYQFRIADASTRIELSSSDQMLETGEWRFVAATMDGGTMRLYVLDEGVLTKTSVSQSGVTPSLTAGTFPIAFGGAGNGDRGFVDAKIDDVRIYNRALSESEIERLHTLGTQGGQRVSGERVPKVLRDGLVGYWTFDADTVSGSSIVDVSRTGNDATDVTGDAVLVDGLYGEALHYDNYSGELLNFGNHSSLKSGIRSFSLWVYRQSDASQYTKIIGDGDYLDESGFYFGDLDNGGQEPYAFRVNGEAGRTLIAQEGSVTLNQWVHYVGVFDGDRQYLYKNGVLEDTSNPGFTVINSNSSDITGGSSATAYVDDIRLYNRALSATEVADIYAGTEFTVGSSFKDRITDGLVAHWTFDGGDINPSTSVVRDNSGNDNSGTLTNGPRAIAGALNQGIDFDGVDDFVQMGSSAAYDIDGGTIVLWVRPTASSSQNQYIVGKDESGTNDGDFGIQIIDNDSGAASNKFSVFTSVSGGAQQLLSTDAVQFGVWYHLAVSFGADGKKLYVNGSLDTENASTTGMTNTTPDFILGSLRGVSDYFEGTLDDVRVYNRILSPTEIRSLYNMGQ